MLLLTLGWARASPCETPYSHTLFLEDLASAEVIIAGLDVHRQLATDANTILQRMECASFRLRSAELAEVYRYRGFGLATIERTVSEGWLAAAYGLEPDFDVPARGGPWLEAWTAGISRWDSRSEQSLPAPIEGQVLVNGLFSRSTPDGIPWSAQHINAGGIVTHTWVNLGGSLPRYPEYHPPEPAELDPIATPTSTPAKKPLPVLPITLVVLGTAGTGAGAALWVDAEIQYASHCAQFDYRACNPPNIYSDFVRPRRTVGATATAIGSTALITGIIWLIAR